MNRLKTKTDRALYLLAVVVGLGWLFSVIPGVVFFAVVAVALGVQALEARARRKPRELNLGPRAKGLVLGQDVKSGEAVVLSDQQMGAHGVILGAAGAGKTTTLLTILRDAIRRGLPVVAIDLKGSPDFAWQLHDAANAAGRSFRIWSFEGPGHWNPLAYGDATELKDKLIAFERFTEPHYQRAAERYLQTAIQVLQVARPERPVTLAAVVSLLEPQTLQQLLQYLPQEMVNRVGPYLSALNRDQKSAISGLQSRLALISESTPGQYLQPDSKPIDLRRALCGGNEVVVFSLNSGRYGKLAAQVAALVIQDLSAVSGYRLGMANRTLGFIAIDEFSALDADNILNLLARARESGISVLLCTQEMTDLERLAAGFRDQVLGIVGMTIAHRQSVPASAELIARMIGTQTAWQHTYQTGPPPAAIDIVGRSLGLKSGPSKTGLGTMREVEEFRIHPNTIKDLPTGRAVLITKIPRAAACIVQVIPGPRDGSDDAH